MDAFKRCPAVSVVICTYNRADLLEKTLMSLLELEDLALAEIIVVDNRSTDHTAATIKGSPSPMVRISISDIIMSANKDCLLLVMQALRYQERKSLLFSMMMQFRVLHGCKRLCQHSGTILS